MFSDIETIFRLNISGCQIITSAESWSNLAHMANYVPVCYSRFHTEDFRAWLKGQDHLHQAIDILVEHEGNPVAIWSLNIVKKNGPLSVESTHGGVRPPLILGNPSHRLIKQIYRKCHQGLLEVCKHLKLENFVAIASSRGQAIDDWHRAIMEFGAVCEIRHELYVDLSWDIDKIWGNFRKSYRPLINKAKHLWKNSIFFGDIPSEVFGEFRQLHFQLAGRITRCIETWNLQEESIRKKSAFLVCLRNKDAKLVGAGLFNVTRDEGSYSVAAYDRELFYYPIGHLVQMLAISHMKSLGLKWYFIGLRPYLGEDPVPTPKELNIGYFKEGFASHCFPRFLLTCPV
jgi:FemAB family protein